MEEEIITLTDEDGKESQYQVIMVKEIGADTYYVLQPLEDNEDEDYVLLKYVIDEEGEPYLITIDDDDEFDKVADLVEDELFIDDDEDSND